MVNFGSILLFAAAVSALPNITKRDTAETVANLQAIDAATNDLTATVASWDGSLLGAIAINTAATTLSSTVDTAILGAQDETAGTSADSQAVIAYITGTLEPDISVALITLVTRKADFDALSLSSLVLDQLNSLKTKTSTYSALLVALASSDQTANAQAAADLISSDFDSAIAVYSS